MPVALAAVEPFAPIILKSLNGIGCALPGGFGKRAGTVTRDDLDTRILLQPGSDGRRTRIGKHCTWPIGAQVDQDGFEVPAFGIGPFVDTKKRGRCAFSRARATNQAQDGRRADGHALALGGARSHLSAHVKPEVALLLR